MLPMGTIMAASMLLAVVLAVEIKGQSLARRMPDMAAKVLASVIFICGLWNVLWYASQHLGEFWGNSAFISGVLLLITSLYLAPLQNFPQILQRMRPLILVLLLGCGLLYSVTIYNL